ncbi:MAG: hypothetical protein AAFR84_14065 [Pseudomonadota bacterium]
MTYRDIYIADVEFIAANGRKVRIATPPSGAMLRSERMAALEDAAAKSESLTDDSLGPIE